MSNITEKQIGECSLFISYLIWHHKDMNKDLGDCFEDSILLAMNRAKIKLFIIKDYILC